MIDDGKLIEGCLKNKRRSQKQLYEKYAPKMLGVCYRYCKSTQDAEDVLQDAFIKVYKSLDSFKNKGSLEGWIRRIVVNTALNHIRSNPVRWFVDVDDTQIPYEDTEKEEVQTVKPEILMSLIQQLPPGYRTVLNLFVFEKYPHKEIARVLDISEGTSRSQYAKAKALLKRKIEEYRK